MLTIFTSLRPFVDPHVVVIQRNAIRSWLALNPRPQVLLMGDDAGVDDVAREFAVQHVPDVRKDRDGIPMRSSMCELAHAAAEHELLCIINSDILILDGLYDALRSIPLHRFVAAGRRHDLDVRDEIAMDADDWRSRLRTKADRTGSLRGPSTMDYVVYSRSIAPPVLPPFPMRSAGWDPWFLYAHRRRGIPVVDVTPVVNVVHQNHESRADVRNKKKAWRNDPDAMAALRRAGGFSSMMTLREADYVLTPSGLRRPFVNRLLSSLLRTGVYRRTLALKRHLQGSHLG